MECSICCEELPLNCFTYNNPMDIFRTSCGHYFHKTCISRWCLNNNSCPVCRKKNIFNFSNRRVRQNGFQVINYNNYINNNINNNIIELDINNNINYNYNSS